MSLKRFAWLQLLPLIIADFSLAATTQIHFSEDSANGNKQNIPNAKGEKDIYLNNGAVKVDTSNIKDMDALRNSVEFEVYQINDNEVSYAVFESKAGICYGFKSSEGINLTDSTTYYVDKTKQNYYATVVGANVSVENVPQNIQYSPLFFIRDPNLSKQVQTEEKKSRPVLIKTNIEKNTQILQNTICD